MRCGCIFQVSYGCPYSHEFTVQVNFDVNQYSKRWLNQRKFEEMYQEQSPSLHVRTSYEYEVDEANIDEDVATTKQNDNSLTKSVHVNVYNIELPQHSNVEKESNIRNNDKHVTYSKLQNLSL